MEEVDMGSGIDKVRVWDPLIRIFHWALVAAFTVAYFTDDEDLLLPHVWAGYAVIGLLAFRFIWGFVGSAHARFSDFIFAPSVVMSFLWDTLQGQAKRYLGHNPAGGWMIILLLATLTLVSVTGLVLYGADEHAGPLAGLMAGAGEDVEEVFEGLHEFFANLTLFLVVIHVAGVAMESVLHKENLVKAMVSGYKRGEGLASVASKSAANRVSLMGGFFAVVMAMFAVGVLGGDGEVKADSPREINLQQKDMNDLIPLESLIKKAEADHAGRLIEAELKSVEGKDIYEIEILDESGKVWETYYDARSGEPIDYEEEEHK
jgi:cytochrome b